MRVRVFAVTACVAALASGVVALSAFGMAGNTWTVNFGDPGHDGAVNLELTFKYTDSHGTQKTAVVGTQTPITASMNDIQKRAAIQSALNTALAGNGIDGNGNGTSTPLGETAGTGDVMAVSPTGNNADFMDCKLTDVKLHDKGTGEKDKVERPSLPGGPGGMGQVEASGEITGFTSSGTPSIFLVATERGMVTVQLSAGMRKLDLLEQIRAGLVRQGARVWIDSDRLVLYMWLADDEKDGPTGIGSSCTDAGVTASTTVIAG